MTDTPECVGAVVVYGCLCSDGADTIEQLPDVCPGHGRPRTGTWVNRTLPGAVATRHDCPTDYPCPKENP